MEYAIQELYHLIGRITEPISDKDPVVHYICALVSELAYYDVNQSDIDNKNRAHLIPCLGYREIVARGTPARFQEYLRSMDINENNSFVLTERGIVVVGIKIRDYLFIGFRGTIPLYISDWKINLRATLVPINTNFRFGCCYPYNCCSGRWHRGFAEESFRISFKLLEEMKRRGVDNVKHVFLTGHSLGGSVAAVSRNLIEVSGATTICIFGSPRYCDIAAYFSLPYRPPMHIRRSGDNVPFSPPLRLGYVDHPNEFDTSGAKLSGRSPAVSLIDQIQLWIRFTCEKFEPHYIEHYRRELGQTAGAEGACLPIAKFEHF